MKRDYFIVRCFTKPFYHILKVYLLQLEYSVLLDAPRQSEYSVLLDVLIN
jgi:hypothetical protein